jgi:hypothetical protein
MRADASATASAFERARRKAPTTDAICTALSRAWALTERQVFMDRMLDCERYLQMGREAPDALLDQCRAELRDAGGWEAGL